MNDIPQFFKDEIGLRKRCMNRYKKMHTAFNGINIAFAALAVTAGLVAIGLASTAEPVLPLIIEGISVGFSGITVGNDYLRQHFKTKMKKHEQLHVQAVLKLEIINRSPESEESILDEYLVLKKSFRA